MDENLFGDLSPGKLVATPFEARAFVPTPLPPVLDLAAIFSEFGDAMAAIGSLNAKIAQLANPQLIIRPLQRREALLSSSIEGTYSTSEELALLEAGAVQKARSDTKEVLNYIEALLQAVDLMNEIPISHRLIRATHHKLLSGLPQGRGGSKLPGEYKTSQNWIGGMTIRSARFVPSPPQEAQMAMDQLESYINRPDPSNLPALIEAALVHYQFETIHPFSDGNGRVGRILIPLIFLARRLTTTPVFYPSASIESRRNEYVDWLFSVSTKGDWIGWLKFFLQVCQDTCANSVEIIDELINLQTKYRDFAVSEFRSSNILVLIDFLFSSPVVTTPIVMNVLAVTHRAARQSIAKLEQIGVLKKMEGSSKPEYFAAHAILRAGT